MGMLLGFLLGRRREQPDVEWGRQLEVWGDELQRQNAVLWDVVTAAERVVPLLSPSTDAERHAVADLREALRAAEDERTGSGT